MNHLFCFHTGKRYGLLARKCARSFAHFGVKVNLIEFQCKEGWMKSCMIRAVRLHELAQKYPNDGVGILDSDLTCLQHPELLVNFQGDLAIHDLTDTQPGKIQPAYRYSAGVSVFGQTPAGRECLRHWAELCTIDPTPKEMIREQQYLYQAIREGTHDKYGNEKTANNLVVKNIGERYNRIIDRWTEGDDTVILHHVASRKLKEMVREAKTRKLALCRVYPLHVGVPLDRKYKSHPTAYDFQEEMFYFKDDPLNILSFKDLSLSEKSLELCCDDSNYKAQRDLADRQAKALKQKRSCVE